MLHEIYRVETNIGRIVIAYSERRRRITEGRSTRDRVARKSLRKLREGERKEDIIYKTARIIEEIAKKHDAALVSGMPIGVRVEWLAKLVRKILGIGSTSGAPQK
jgi:hypothetical protein